MSTGNRICGPWARKSGFTLVELLVGITLASLIAAGVGPLVVSIQRYGVCEGDRTVSVIQGRVAGARLEKDLRTATAEDCPFPVSGPILEAGSRQIVFLSVGSDGETLLIVEWELVGSTLMRRWGRCPSQKPALFPHTLYLDNKTMLQGVASGGEFSYGLEGGGSTTEVPERDLSRVAAVTLDCDGVDADGGWSTLLAVRARVAR